MADAAIFLTSRQVPDRQPGEIGLIGLINLRQGQVSRSNDIVTVLQVEPGARDNRAAVRRNAKAKLTCCWLVIGVCEASSDARAVDHMARVDSAIVAEVDRVANPRAEG